MYYEAQLYRYNHFICYCLLNIEYLYAKELKQIPKAWNKEKGWLTYIIKVSLPVLPNSSLISGSIVHLFNLHSRENDIWKFFTEGFIALSE